MHTCVGILVPFKLCRRDERLLAQTAFEGPDPAVRLLVVLQVKQIVIAFSADVTPK